MKLKINLFRTLYDLNITLKVTKRVPKYVTVRSDTTWIYAGFKFKVDSVYMEETKYDDPGSGRKLRLLVSGSDYAKIHPESSYKTTVISERDLILHY